MIGGGLLDVLASTEATVSLFPVTLSFGGVPPSKNKEIRKSGQVTLTNTGQSALVASVNVVEATPGVSFSVSPSAITLAPGASIQLSVSVTAPPNAPEDFYQAQIAIIQGSQEIAHLPLLLVIGNGRAHPIPPAKNDKSK